MNRYFISLLALLSLLFLHISTAKCQQPPTIEWQKFYASNGGGVSIIPTSDSGFMILANTESSPEVHSSEYSNYDVEIIKLRSSGEVEWQTFFGSDADEFASSIIQTNDGGFAIVGRVGYITNDIAAYGENYDAFIYKVNAVGEVEWRKFLGGSARDGAESILQLADNSYLVAANTSSYDRDVSSYIGGSQDAWLVRLDPSGKILSEKCFGGSDMDGVKRILRTHDGGYVFAGELSSKDAGIKTELRGLNTWIVKLSERLDVEWQKVYGGSYFQNVSDIKQTTHGGFVIVSSAGVYQSKRPVERDGDVTGLYGDQHDIWILRLNSIGQLVWQKIIGGSNYDQGFRAFPMKTGSFLVVGYTNSKDGNISNYKGGKNDALLVQLDSNGSIEWQRNVGGSAEDALYAASECKEGGYIALGYTTSRDGDVMQTTDSGIWVVKFRGATTQNTRIADDLSFRIYAYPNPVSRILKIGYSDIGNETNVVVKVTDAAGRQVKESSRLIEKGNRNEVSFDVSSLTEGVYYVTVSSESHSESIKVVVVK